MIPNCGGCNDLGAHTRWCPAIHGRRAARYASQAARAEAIADEVGVSCPHAANALYRAAGLLNAEATIASQQHRDRKASQ